MGRRFRLIPQGDRAVSVVFPAQISPEIHGQVVALDRALEQAPREGVLGTLPSYHTLMVEYDPRVLSYRQVCRWIRRAAGGLEQSAGGGRLVRVPVCYGGNFGPDLEEVAAHTGLSPEEVVCRHSAGEYRVYLLGFRPGFPYLGGMDPTIGAPRRPTPRQRIPAGSVGIAGEQTGIYPEESPGGWNLIGRTPLRLFDEEKLTSLLRPGDVLRFDPVDPEVYQAVAEKGVWPL